MRGAHLGAATDVLNSCDVDRGKISKSKQATQQLEVERS